MTILYLHGLESKLSDEKRTVLQQFGTVIAPDMDYKSNSEVFGYLMKTYKNETIDCIIGSSMGGFMGYHLAMTFGCPALLFNPALAKRSVHQEIPETIKPKNHQRFSVVLGGKDQTVKPKKTLKFFSKNFLPKVQLEIKIRPELEHPIPLDVFTEECSAFLRSL